MTQPVRITSSRVKGSKLTSPNGLPIACVDRTSKWGNPHKLEPLSNKGRYAAGRRASIEAERRAQAVEKFRLDLKNGRLTYTVEDVKRELRGRNLACWCAAGLACHADVLLETANS